LLPYPLPGYKLLNIDHFLNNKQQDSILLQEKRQLMEVVLKEHFHHF